MRLVLRSQVRAAAVSAPAPRQTATRQNGDARRAWIEALFGDHLPRGGARREAAIDALAGDGSVWRVLHQARHSMVETSAAIERLARAALSGEPRAA